VNELVLLPQLISRNGKDIEYIIATIGVANLLKLAPHFLAIAETYSEITKGK